MSADAGSDSDNESASSSSIHLPFNISRENVEKRSNEICRSLIKLFENVDQKLCRFENDLKTDASNQVRNFLKSLMLSYTTNKIPFGEREIGCCQAAE